MIVTFEEKENKKYEIQNKHVDEIFENVKKGMLNIFEQYKKSDKDLAIATIAAGSLGKELNQWLSNEYGADEIIKITEAEELQEGE